MQVSGIWILEGTSSYRAPIHPHLVLQIGVGGVAVDVLGRTEMLQTKFPVHEGFQLKNGIRKTTACKLNESSKKIQGPDPVSMYFGFKSTQSLV